MTTKVDEIAPRALSPMPYTDRLQRAG